MEKSRRNKYTIDEVKEYAIGKKGKCLSSTYKNNKENLKWQYDKCNNIWKARLDRIKSGTWCPKCRMSHGEKQIAKYLDNNLIKYYKEFYAGKNRMRFDFFIPHINLAIEFDGIQHFQVYRRYTPTKEVLVKRQQFDIDKTLFCIDNNIKLVRIHYTSLNHIHIILHKILEQKDSLMFTEWRPYEYIIKKLNPHTQFLMLLTGVG